MRKRFRFAVGTVVTVVGDKRLRRRIVARRYMYEPPKNDVYWLDSPVGGFGYFNGDDLIRVRGIRALVTRTKMPVRRRAVRK